MGDGRKMGSMATLNVQPICVRKGDKGKESLFEYS